MRRGAVTAVCARGGQIEPVPETQELPAALPFGPRSIGSYASCALCSFLAPLRDPDHVNLRAHDEAGRSRVMVRLAVPSPTGAWLRFGATPICPTHAREIGAAAGPSRGGST